MNRADVDNETINILERMIKDRKTEN